MERFTLAVDVWIILTWQEVLSRLDQDVGGSQADPHLKLTGSAPTSSCLLSVLGKQPRTSAAVAVVAAVPEGGNSSGCARGGRAGLVGRCRRQAHPWTKRRERFSGSAPEIPRSHCQSRNPTNCYNNCDSLSESFDKVHNFQVNIAHLC